jgi:nucleoside 2-deoxyribosyltransferase
MKSVVLYGSGRFKAEARKFAAGLKKYGVTVYEPYFHRGGEEWDKMSDQYKNYTALGLTHDHFYKIKMADVVFIYNKDGYMGNSSTMELGYAMALGKPIYAFSDKDDERCRRVLFRGIVKTPKELVSKL